MSVSLFNCLNCQRRQVHNRECDYCGCAFLNTTKGDYVKNRFEVFCGGKPTGYCTDKINDAIRVMKSLARLHGGTATVYMRVMRLHLIKYSLTMPNAIKIWGRMLERSDADYERECSIASSWKIINNTGS